MLASSASAMLAAVETPKITISAASSASEFTTFLVYIIFTLDYECRASRHVDLVTNLYCTSRANLGNPF